MGLCGGASGGGSTTTTSKLSKQSPFEQDILGTGGAIYDQILSDMGYERVPTAQRDFAAELATAKASGDKAAVKEITTAQKAASKSAGKYGATPFTLQKRALTPAEQQQADYEADLTNQYQGVLLGKTPLNPATQGWLDEYYGNAQSETQQAIDKATYAGAEQRGMDLADTPIGNPYLRITAENARNISGQKAQASVGARYQDLANAGGYMSYMDTLKNLKTFQNPLSLANALSGFGTNLYTARFNKGTTTTSGGGTSAAGLGGLLGGAGGFMTALKTAAII